MCLYRVVVLMCISSLNVYGRFMSGWSSRSNYAILGCMRSVAQTISYEVTIGIIIISVLCFHQSLEISHIYVSEVLVGVVSAPIFFLWLVICLAETNRTPLDLIEGESELVSGLNVEYRGLILALIFMAEYMRIIFLCLFTSVTFLGLTSPVLVVLLTGVIIFFIVITRGTLPRIRYDKLIHLT